MEYQSQGTSNRRDFARKCLWRNPTRGPCDDDDPARYPISLLHDTLVVTPLLDFDANIAMDIGILYAWSKWLSNTEQFTNLGDLVVQSWGDGHLLRS